MGKYTIEEAAKLLAESKFNIHVDVKNLEILKSVLFLAFPKDESTQNYTFLNYMDNIFGISSKSKHVWSDTWSTIHDLDNIYLSDIISKEELKGIHPDYDILTESEPKSNDSKLMNNISDNKPKKTSSMKKYIFTICIDNEEEKGVELVPILAKNMQSAIAKLCLEDYYSEDQISNVAIIKK